MTFAEMMSNKLAFITTDNVIYTTINGVFGPSGELPLFNAALTTYLTYFVIVELAHLIVDVLLFIPRLAHNWMSYFSKKGE